MKRSTSRILTTHVGSLARPARLLELARAQQKDDEIDARAYDECLQSSVAEVVRRQVEVGIDIVNDGEFGKSTSWSLYPLQRLSGFELRPVPPGRQPFRAWRGPGALPGVLRRARRQQTSAPGRTSPRTMPSASAPSGTPAFPSSSATSPTSKRRSKACTVEEAFLPVAAPSSTIPDRKNEYYASDEELLAALAEAMRTEYRSIVDAGFLLQIDDARAAVTYDRMVPPASFDDYYRWVNRHVEVLNYALEGIPEDRVRYHVCWGSWPGPHTTDVPLRKIVDLILKVRAGAYLIEAANPRHEHEWRVWQDVKLPEGKILAPGVVSHGTNVVEHPELVAERILRFAGAVGRENVIASTDCGFAQEQFNRRVHPSIIWAKLEAMAEGARIATKELWGRPAQSSHRRIRP